MPTSSHTSRLPRADYLLAQRLRVGLKPASGAGVLLAVSGGGDSMAMLHLATLLPHSSRPPNLRVAVVNHRLRPEAAAERDLVMSVCDACSIPGSVLDAGAAGDDEAGLRKARYAALREHAADHRLPWIATAHTRDDQVETILFRLARGTGRRGLSGISPVRNGLLRPLLDASRQELRDFLQRRQLAYCEDSSNDSDRYARNRIRHTVVPAFREALGEDALDRVPAMARRWRLDEEYLGSEVERFTIWCERGPKGELDLAALDQCPLPLRGRILRRWFERRDGRPTLGVAEIEILEGLVIAAPHAQIDLGTLHVARAPGRLTASRR